MDLTAFRGAMGFLSRIPVGHDATAWKSFQRTPTSIPLAGYVIGALVALPVLLPVPSPTVAFVFVVGIYIVTGINHIDGVIDLGDALVIHGDTAERRAVMKDTTVGAGGALAVVVTVFGLTTAGLALAALPVQATLLVVTAEVGAKLGMTLLVCLGSAPHEGLGSALTANASPTSAVPAVLVTVPAALVMWPRVASSIAALLAAVVAALFILRWAQANLGGVSGDVLGATNEVTRIVALHVGVVVWTHY